MNDVNHIQMIFIQICLRSSRFLFTILEGFWKKLTSMFRNVTGQAFTISAFLRSKSTPISFVLKAPAGIRPCW